MNCMATSTLTPAEEAQLGQTIEMFEVITQSQPNDYQSLEILKEAYSKLGREDDAKQMARRIAQSYVQMGQYSSAILEYETILQQSPDDIEVQSALKEIEVKASSISAQENPEATTAQRRGDTTRLSKPSGATSLEVEDGRRAMQKLFVDGKHITQADFDLCWPEVDPFGAPSAVVEPFVQVLADKQVHPIEKSLKILSDKSRLVFMPLQNYDIDMDLARSFPAETCRRWCVLPIDRMSKSILVATANPFNQQAAKELTRTSRNQVIWYLVPPVELAKNVRKAFR